MSANRTPLEQVALACRKGLNLQWIPVRSVRGCFRHRGASGLETLQYEGEYVCARHRPQLKSEAFHAWFEIGDVIYDQFPATGLYGWAFDRMDGTRFYNPKSDVKDFALPSSGLLTHLMDTKQPKMRSRK